MREALRRTRPILLMGHAGPRSGDDASERMPPWLRFGASNAGASAAETKLTSPGPKVHSEPAPD